MPFACFKNSPNRFAGFQTIKYNFEREVLLFSPLAKRFSLTGNQPERNFRGLRNVQSVRKPKNTTNTANSVNSVNTINTVKPTKPKCVKSDKYDKTNNEKNEKRNTKDNYAEKRVALLYFGLCRPYI